MRLKGAGAGPEAGGGGAAAAGGAAATGDRGLDLATAPSKLREAGVTSNRVAPEWMRQGVSVPGAGAGAGAKVGPKHARARATQGVAWSGVE